MRTGFLRRIGALPLMLTLLALPVHAMRIEPPSAEDVRAAAARSDGPRINGLSIPAAATTASHGEWSDDGRRWTLDVTAAGATWLAFRFDQVDLPAGAALHVHSADGQLTQGPYTMAHARKGRLWTPLVPGAAATVELELAQAGDAHLLSLAAVQYGFRDADAGRVSAKAGGCNVDVVCPAGDDWRNQIDSTVLLQLQFNSSQVGFCTATLINNPRRDRTPYLLTADHCGVTPGNDDSVVIYWQYQTDECRPQGGSHPPQSNPDPSRSQVGTEFLANGQVSAPAGHPDFNLLVIGSAVTPQVPPVAFSPFWSGWDRRDDRVASSGVGIHHPSGDEKAISRFDNPVIADTVDIGEPGRPDIVHSWRVVWDLGTTEVGSSGSGLWNQDRRLVGQLSGGEAACGNQSAPDFYGRFDLAWEWEESAGRQLRAWLDPDCINPLAVNGMRYDDKPVNVSEASAVSAAGVCDDDPPPPPPPPTPDSGGGAAGGAWLLLMLAAGLQRRRHMGTKGRARWNSNSS